MGYILLDGSRITTRPEPGVLFKFEFPCNGAHHIAEAIICKNCGRDFCEDCSGPATLDWTTCPDCEWSWYNICED